MTKYASHSPATTAGIASRWALELVASERLDKGPVTLGLAGDLGAGKTVFVQGLARGLGIQAAVVSPTFTLVNEYEGSGRRLIHVDLYRMETAAEAACLGLEDYLCPRTVVAIEWMERLGNAKKILDFQVILENIGGRNRCVKISSY